MYSHMKPLHTNMKIAEQKVKKTSSFTWISFPQLYHKPLLFAYKTIMPTQTIHILL